MYRQTKMQSKYIIVWLKNVAVLLSFYLSSSEQYLLFLGNDLFSLDNTNVNINYRVNINMLIYTYNALDKYKTNQHFCQCHPIVSFE